MKQPGRPGTLRRSTASLIGSPVRLTPPAELDELEREVFASIVASCPAEHFRVSDLPLLASYAAAVVRERRARGEFDREPILADGRPSPWGIVLAQATKTMLGLSLRLRLSPQGRGKPSTKAEAQLSYYERMALIEPPEVEVEQSDDPATPS